MGIPICGACRRPIEERVVTALGKQWHVEHFVCAKCEKPFFGHKHYEKKVGQIFYRFPIDSIDLFWILYFFSNRDWLIVKHIIINYLEMFVLFVVK